MAYIRSDAEVKKLYDKWISDPYFSAYRAELESVKNDPAAIRDRFYRDPEFGTAGVRAIMGAGTARLNVPVVRLITRGIAGHILEEGACAAERGVLIGFDTRNNSKLFAREAAKVLAGMGINVILSRNPVPVPVVSFLIRHTGSEMGVMITASHNPKEYNGYKVYGADGAQLSPEHSDAICREIEKAGAIENIPEYDFDTLRKAGRISYVKNSDLACYMDTLVRLGLERAGYSGLNSENRRLEALNDLRKTMSGLRVVYTPLHGAGAAFVPKLLTYFGVTELFKVSAQMKADGNFPTVAVPNPESAESFTLALKLAKKADADIILATDPDSDRTGAMIKTGPGRYGILNGNQLGVILLKYILDRPLPENPFAVSTVVSTRMAEKLCAAKGVKYVDVLTGFKYIGEQIMELEENGNGHFVFGFEESYGYLAGSYARDKDAVASCMLLCMLAAGLKAGGRSMTDALEDVYRITGCWSECQVSKVFPGESGTEEMKRIMDEARRRGVCLLEGDTPLEILDVLKGERVCYSEDGTETGREKLSYPESNVLRLAYKDFWFCLRPSGTEPKIKLYFGAQGASASEASKNAAKLSERVLEALQTF